MLELEQDQNYGKDGLIKFIKEQQKIGDCEKTGINVFITNINNHIEDDFAEMDVELEKGNYIVLKDAETGKE